MKIKTAFAILFVSMLMVQDAESWFFRMSDFIKHICKLSCPRSCKMVFTDGEASFVCTFACVSVCGKKKREAIENYHVTPLTRDMDFYDLNDDDYVSIMELSQTLGQTMADSGLLQAFNQTDTDQDARLSEEELFGPNSYFVFSEMESTRTAN